MPIRVHLRYKCILFCSRSFFELFFSCDCTIHIIGTFIVHQFMDIVLFCKAISQSIAMFIQPTFEVTSNTDIYNRIIPVGENVHIVHTARSLCDIMHEISAKILRLASLAQDDRYGQSPRQSMKMGICFSQLASEWLPPGTIRNARFTRLVSSRWAVEIMDSWEAAWLNISSSP